MFDDLYFIDLVVVYFVLCYLRFIVSLCFFSPSFNFDVLSTSLEIGSEERVFHMTYLVLSGTLNFNSANKYISEAIKFGV